MVCNYLTASVANRMDPLQFAYKAKRVVEDATLTHMELVTHHLDQTGTFIRILMMDFSSAFNTLQTHSLLSRLLDLDVSPTIILSVRAFLCDRPPTVCVNSVKSNELILNTGAPRDVSCHPYSFQSTQNEIMSNTTTLTLIKIADDMALVARLKDEQSLSSYFNFIGHLISWFDASYLNLNVKKTKEFFIEKHRARDISLLQPVRIKTEDVESVKTFKYLGTVKDSNLSFTTHVNTVCKKVNQRMYLIRKLKTFDVDKKMLEMIYRSLVERILTFNIVTFYGHSRLNKRTG